MSVSLVLRFQLCFFQAKVTCENTGPVFKAWNMWLIKSLLASTDRQAYKLKHDPVI